MELSINNPEVVEGPVFFEGHYHGRFDHFLQSTIPAVASWASDVLMMPNRAPTPLITVDEVLEYRKQVLDAAPRGDFEFNPVMTISLTEEVTKEGLRAVLECPHILAVKLYAGHTTNAAGVSDLSVFDWAFAMIEESGKLLLVHGETDSENPWNREREFYLDDPRAPAERLRRAFPALRIVAEHISTIEAVEFAWRHPNVWATITAHHLLITARDMAGGAFNVQFWCKPPVQFEKDRRALLAAATSGDPRFYLGTDSAPHPKDTKYTLGSAGCFTALTAPELYATAFASVGKLDKLFDFGSKFGRTAYGLSIPKGRLSIARSEPWQPPLEYEFGHGATVPFRLSKPLEWKASRIV